jgi:hypothetical protein
MARNYSRLFYATLDVNEAGPVTNYVVFGQFEGQALSRANFYGNLFTSGQPTWSFEVGTEAPYYVLYQSGLMSSYIVQIQQNYGPDPFMFNMFQSIASGFGVDGTISPKLQNHRPWNGRKRGPF